MKRVFLVLLLVLLIPIISACSKLGGQENKKVAVDNNQLIGYFINDSRCSAENCDSTFSDRVKKSLEQLFPSIKFTEYDYNSDSGKQFYKKYKLKLLPALLLTQKIKDEDKYNNIKNYLVAKDDLFDLKLGATFNPQTGLHTVEFCDNKVDDNGDSLTDCDDPMCTNNLICRDETPKKLDLFVMSHCPYGTKALDAMKEVLDNFDGALDFNVHYIATENSDGSFKSLHGQKEVDDDARELCAMRYYPKNYKYMEYIWCRDADLNADESKCSQDFPKVKTCFKNGEGYKLLSKNIKLASELQIGASPTWVANDRYKFSGIDANTVQKNVCQYNPNLGDACDKKLSTQTAPAGACN